MGVSDKEAFVPSNTETGGQLLKKAKLQCVCSGTCELTEPLVQLCATVHCPGGESSVGWCDQYRAVLLVVGGVRQPA